MLLTNSPGLYTADPPAARCPAYPDSQNQIDDATWALAGGAGTSVGTGGMLKIQAARSSPAAAGDDLHRRQQRPNVLERIVGGEALGTRFLPGSTQVESRKPAGAGGSVKAEVDPAGYTQREGGAVCCRQVASWKEKRCRANCWAMGAGRQGDCARADRACMAPAMFSCAAGRSHQNHQILRTSVMVEGAVIHRNNMVVLSKRSPEYPEC
ncbi:MAG: hypothetical protein R3E39_20765 [Anaerolineae bacterium]